MRLLWKIPFHPRDRQGKRALVAEWEILPGGFEQARRNAKIKGWDE